MTCDRLALCIGYILSVNAFPSVCPIFWTFMTQFDFSVFIKHATHTHTHMGNCSARLRQSSTKKRPHAFHETYTHTHTHTHTCARRSTYNCKHTRTHACTHAHTQKPHIHTCVKGTCSARLHQSGSTENRFAASVWCPVGALTGRMKQVKASMDSSASKTSALRVCVCVQV
jgi:quinol monooxygenase YgiN